MRLRSDGCPGQIREDFPIFRNLGESEIYFDSAATSQKPQAVIDRMEHFYCFENSNIHRGLYPLSRRASDAFEQARETVREWIGAEAPEEVVFTKSSTEAVNLAAAALFESRMEPGDNVIVTELEHSSNFFPWEHQCRRFGCEFRTAEADGSGSIRAEDIIRLTDPRTKIIAVTGMSNATGFMPDLDDLIREAHCRNILVFVDGTQLIVHRKLSVREMDCDLLCFSGHKLYGPMGIGVLYGKRKLLCEMAPFLYGGDMVERGDGGRIVYRDDPGKYEAGTQNIAGALGLEAALDYLRAREFETVLIPYEEELSTYLEERMSEIPGLKRVGRTEQHSPIFNFTMEHFGAYDIGTYLAAYGIAVRVGSHCAYPLMKRLGEEAAVRISLAFYNTKKEIDTLTERLYMLSSRIT